MTDKEIYKMDLMEVLDFARENAIQQGKRHFLKRIHTISRLIDRQPTEGKAKEAWDVLQQGLSRCESMNEKACARCSKFKGCQEGEEIIRKALGIKDTP